MAKANQAYHKRDLCSEVTARIPAVTGSEMTLARYYAKQSVKAQWQREGRCWVHVEASELNQAATAYLSQHREELIERACATLRTFEQNRKR